jgi:excisionase family DNA binding protein
VTDLESTIRELVRDELRKLASPPADEYMSTHDAAKLADVARGTIRRWVKSGKLPGHWAGRLVRVKRADLERLLRDGKPRNDSSTPEQRASRKYG